MEVLAAVGRWGLSLVETRRGGAGSAARGVQQRLAAGDLRSAWAERARLRAGAAGRGAADLDVEALLALGVAAAAAGHYTEAVEDFSEAAAVAAGRAETELEAAVRRFGEHAGLLAQQSLAEGRFAHGAQWREEGEADSLEQGVPAAWLPWVAAMPQTAEYCGPVEVGWLGERDGHGRRGLLAARDVSPGEVLLALRPIAWAATSGEPLVAALRAAARSSGRARRWLACLADGSHGGASPSPGEVSDSLRSLADEPACAAPGDAPELDLQGIIATNAFRTGAQGSSAVYGLPSMCNHSCDGAASAVLRHIRRDGTIVLWTARAFAKGEEILIRYFSCDAPLHVRQELCTSHWGFSCACCRCTFESCHLPGSPAARAVDDAMAAWKGQLKQTWSELASPPAPEDLRGAAGASGQSPQDLLCALVDAVGRVEAAAKAEAGWGDAEVAWCLSLVQPLSSAALWCLMDEARRGDPSPAAVARRCDVLEWIVAALARTESGGFSHLRSLRLLWSARREAARIPDAAEPGRAAAVQAEGLARRQLEHACWVRFGVTAEALDLDAADSPVTRLLQSLRL
mmetsp:Transcript_64114/g.202623  ORF Transcript_64114/g.202623 Transcript_64114/m.202623 type:complete len:572 (+) Transcript_64114:113-1828(+)